MDAAIAANAALGLMEPTGAGLGGDLFALVWDPKARQLHGLNASGRSPRSLTLEHFRNWGSSASPQGSAAGSVPGAADGWFELHAKFGRLPMASVLALVIRYADEGFPVSEVIACGMAKDMALLGEYPGFLETFSVDGTRAPRPRGLAQPQAGQDPRPPGRGGAGRLLPGPDRPGDRRLHESPGRVPQLRRPRLPPWRVGRSRERGLPRLRRVGAPRQRPGHRGPADAQHPGRLRFLPDFFGSPGHVHLFTEAKKLVFEDRANFYGDPAFAGCPCGACWTRPTPRAGAPSSTRTGPPGAWRQAIPPWRTATPLPHGGPPGRQDGEPDQAFRGMGSGMTPALGFCLQDRAELFSLEAGQANIYATGKGLFHTIIPGFITKAGEPFLSFGVMGGASSPWATCISHDIVDFGMGIQERRCPPHGPHRFSGAHRREGRPSGHDPAGKRFPDRNGAGADEHGSRGGLVPGQLRRVPGHPVGSGAEGVLRCEREPQGRPGGGVLNGCAPHGGRVWRPLPHSRPPMPLWAPGGRRTLAPEVADGAPVHRVPPWSDPGGGPARAGPDPRPGPRPGRERRGQIRRRGGVPGPARLPGQPRRGEGRFLAVRDGSGSSSSTTWIPRTLGTSPDSSGSSPAPPWIRRWCGSSWPSTASRCPSTAGISRGSSSTAPSTSARTSIPSAGVGFNARRDEALMYASFCSCWRTATAPWSC